MTDTPHQIPLRIPADMWPRVKKSVEAHDMSVNEFMITLIQKAFDHADRKAAADTLGDQP